MSDVRGLGICQARYAQSVAISSSMKESAVWTYYCSKNPCS